MSRSYIELNLEKAAAKASNDEDRKLILAKLDHFRSTAKDLEKTACNDDSAHNTSFFGTVDIYGMINWIKSKTSKGGLSYSLVGITPFFTFGYLDDVDESTVSVSNDKRNISVRCNDGSKFEINCSSTIAVTVWKSIPTTLQAGNFCMLNSFAVTKSPSNDGNFTYTNIKANSISLWEQAPKSYQMYNLINKLYGSSNMKIRAIDPKIFPPLQIVNNAVIESRRNNAMKQAKVDDFDKLSDEIKNKIMKDPIENKERSVVFVRAFRRYIRENEFESNMSNHINGQANIIFPCCTTKAGIEVAMEDTVVSVSKTRWTDDITSGKVVNDANYPFDKKILVKGTTDAVIHHFDKMPFKTEAFSIATKLFHKTITNAFGIANPDTLQLLLPKFLEKCDVSIIGSVDLEDTTRMQLNTTKILKVHDTRKYGLYVNVFACYTDILSALRYKIGVPVDSKYAVSALKDFISRHNKSSTSTNIVDMSALVGEKKFDWCSNYGKFQEIYHKSIINCQETNTKWTTEDDDKWRFYSVSNIVFEKEYLESLKKSSKDFFNQNGDENQLNELTKKFTASLSAMKNMEGIPKDCPKLTRSHNFVEVIFAVSKRLDKERTIYDLSSICPNNDKNDKKSLKNDDKIIISNNNNNTTSSTSNSYASSSSNNNNNNNNNNNKQDVIINSDDDDDDDDDKIDLNKTTNDISDDDTDTFDLNKSTKNISDDDTFNTVENISDFDDLDDDDFKLLDEVEKQQIIKKKSPSPTRKRGLQKTKRTTSLRSSKRRKK